MNAFASWFRNAVTSMNVLDVLSMAILLWTAVRVWAGRPARLLRRMRRRTLRKLDGGSRSVAAAWKRHRQADAQAERLIHGEQITTAEELGWLSAALGCSDDLSVTFENEARIRDVARAYERHAARLEKGSLLGANQAPVVLADAERARNVARLTNSYRSVAPVEALTDERQGLGEGEFHVASRDGLRVSVAGAVWAQESPLHAQDLVVSYRDSRLVVRPGQQNLTEHTRLVEAEDLLAVEERIGRELDRPHLFDGALPRLVAARGARDIKSGRRVLHLQVAQTMYSAVLADHYPNAGRAEGEPPRDVDGSRIGLLTLSAVIVTSSRHLVFIRRSKRSGSHQSKLGPAANGNLEFDSRRGVAVDLDEDGMPDFRRALAREAREEIGAELDPSKIVITGLGRFWVPSERGTHVLLGCAQTQATRDEILAGMQNADPVEGAWEVDETLVTLRTPRTESEFQDAVRWLVLNSELSPHATLAGLGALAVTGRREDVFTAASNIAASWNSRSSQPEEFQRCALVEVSRPNGTWSPYEPQRAT